MKNRMNAGRKKIVWLVWGLATVAFLYLMGTNYATLKENEARSGQDLTNKDYRGYKGYGDGMYTDDNARTRKDKQRLENIFWGFLLFQAVFWGGAYFFLRNRDGGKEAGKSNY